MGTPAPGGTGIVLIGDEWERLVGAAAELDELGYSSLWLPGAFVPGLDGIAEVLDTTRSALVSTAVLAVDQYPAQDVAALCARLHREHPGRFTAGLGGAHGPRPLRTLGGYLDRLDGADPPVPAGARILAALGPRMLDLARERACGALPVLGTPEHTADARRRLGPGRSLVVQQAVVLDTDRARARDTARAMVGFLRDAEGGYRRHFARMGFTDADTDELSDRLIDAIVACGDATGIARRVAEQRAAGADHIALMTLTGPSDSPIPAWRELAPATLPPT